MKHHQPQKSMLFMEPIGLLLSSQDHATGPDIEVHEFSPQPHSLFL